MGTRLVLRLIAERRSRFISFRASLIGRFRVGGHFFFLHPPNLGPPLARVTAVDSVNGSFMARSQSQQARRP